MKILHTSDLHLKNVGDERWQALEEILELAKNEKVNLLIISGDLFDRHYDAQNLRDKIRPLFSGNDFKIIIIPGNHDRDAFVKGYDFGSDVIVLDEENYSVELDDLKIFGMAFKEFTQDEILKNLRKYSRETTKEKPNILVFHGELLDVVYRPEDFGEEEKNYMPVKLAYFKGLNFDYILAGHFHTGFYVNEFEKGKYFVYPGSPVSITKKETGKRKVNLMEIGAPPQEKEIDSFHYERLEIFLDPSKNENPLKILQNRLKKLGKNAQGILRMEGYYNSEVLGLTEEELKREIMRLCGDKCVDIDKGFRCIDLKIIAEDDIVKKFTKKLEQRNIDEERRRDLFNLIVKAMLELKYGGK